MKKLLSLVLCATLMLTLLVVPAFSLDIGTGNDDTEHNVTDIFGRRAATVTYYVGDNIDGETVEGYLEDDVFVIDKLPETKVEGKYFTGWYTSADLSGEPVEEVLLNYGDNKLYAGFTSYINTHNEVFSLAENKVNYPILNENGYSANVAKWLTGYGGWKIDDGVLTHTLGVAGAGWGQTSTMAFADTKGNAIRVEPDSTYKVTLSVKGTTLDLEALKNDYPDIEYTPKVTVSLGAGVYYKHNDTSGYYVEGEKGFVNSSNNITVALDGEWHTVTAYFTTGDLSAEAIYIAGIRSSLSGLPNVDGQYLKDYGVNVNYFKDIVIENVSADKMQETEVEDTPADYIKIADYVKDKTVYCARIRYRATEATGIAFMTAEQGNVLENRGFVEAPNYVVGTLDPYAYDTFVNLYFTVDKKGGEIGQGDALYLYVPGGADTIAIRCVELTEIGTVIGNSGVSMIKTDDLEAEQALRYYFNYDTTSGKNVIIEGNTYTVTSRGFLMTDGGRFADEAITRENAKTNSKILDFNVGGEDLTKCWKVELNDGNLSNVTFSTYVKDFLAEEGTYNASKKLYVKGYIEVVISGRTYTFYSCESNFTVKDVADLQNYHNQGDFANGNDGAPTTYGDRVLVWNQEFNVDGILDGVTLKYDTMTSKDAELTTSTSEENVFVKDGNLVLRMIDNGDGTFTTAQSLTTINKMAFKYGYVEMKAKMPYQYGMWFSFWMQPDKNLLSPQQDLYGEVDIVETYWQNHSTEATLHKWSRTLSGSVTQNLDGVDMSNHEGNKKYVFENYENLKNEYHIYGFEWTSEFMKFYIDGVCYYTIYISEEDEFSNDRIGMECFHDYYYLCWNNWMHASYADSLVLENGYADYAIDYVRIYQNSETEYIVKY